MANVARFDRFGEVKKELLQKQEEGRKLIQEGGKNKSKINIDGKKITVRGKKNNEGENFDEGGMNVVENCELPLARKQILDEVKLIAVGSEEEREKQSLNVVGGGEVSYAEILKGKKISHDGGPDKGKSVVNVLRKFTSDNDDVVWASKGALARVLNGEFIPSVQQKIIDVGFDNVRVLPRGGDNVVLFCPGI